MVWKKYKFCTIYVFHLLIFSWFSRGIDKIMRIYENKCDRFFRVIKLFFENLMTRGLTFGPSLPRRLCSFIDLCINLWNKPMRLLIKI